MSVLIVGAGPSGARLAIQLARAGAEVTLVDRLADPHRHAYSSGALPGGGNGVILSLIHI